MCGWWFRVLLIDLTGEVYRVVEVPRDVYLKFLGGRGLSLYLLWTLQAPGTPPLSPEAHLVIASGPLTATLVPGSCKLVVAGKSPLTGTYGDGSIGTYAALALKQCGVDAVVLRGRAREPVVLLISERGVEFRYWPELWGRGAVETIAKLYSELGHDVGVLAIGPGGEAQVSFATVISDLGRSGGRFGAGAILGSKYVKALVFDGTKSVPVKDLAELRRVFREMCEYLWSRENFDLWTRRGTLTTLELAQKLRCLPYRNFRDNMVPYLEEISSEKIEKFYKVLTYSCPLCPIPCGNICYVRSGPYAGTWAEVDYEQVAMLGTNCGLKSLDEILYLVRLCDEYGLDALSAGSCIAFVMECFETGLIRKDWTEGKTIRFGRVRDAEWILKLIVEKRGVGALLAESLRRAAEEIGGYAKDFAMEVKGLPITGYDCRRFLLMALAYGTSPIGAHHKDAWTIPIEEQVQDLETAVQKLIELQDIRGGFFECASVCRFPWVELGLPLEYYFRALRAVTGITFTYVDLRVLGARVYTMARCFLLREYRNLSPDLDWVPPRWFEEPDSSGTALRRDLYERVLKLYYRYRGWSEEGVPRRVTVEKLGLDFVVRDLEELGITLP